MSEDHNGNAAQTRIIADQVADVAIARFTSQHPEIGNGLPGVYKWMGGIVAVLFATFGIWLVGTFNDMQITLARIDERVSNNVISSETRLQGIERRISDLEQGDKEARR